MQEKTDIELPIQAAEGALKVAHVFLLTNSVNPGQETEKMSRARQSETTMTGIPAAIWIKCRCV